MPAIEDHSYLKICAQLASCMSISLAAARRKVELIAAGKGVRSIEDRKTIAEELLEKVRSQSEEGKKASLQLDHLLTALEEDENFMVED